MNDKEALKWVEEFSMRIREPHKEQTDPICRVIPDFLIEHLQKKEAHAMNALKVEYNGFTGELVNLERYQDEDYFGKFLDVYKISIYDSVKKVSISADGVKLEDIKFLGGAVSFG